MSSNVSLTALCQSVTTLVNSAGAIPFATLTSFINSGYQQLYDKLTDALQDYNLSITTFSTSSVTNFYPIPQDFYKLVGMDVLWQGTATSSGAQWLNLGKFNWKDRNIYNSSFFMASLAPGPYYRYRVVGQNFELIPYPQGANIIRVWYNPTPTLLVNNSDTIDDIQGWSQYIVNFAAIQCLIAQQLDTSQLERQQQLQEARITEMARIQEMMVNLRQLLLPPNQRREIILALVGITGRGNL